MRDEYVEALESEIEKLRAELNRLPGFQRLRLLERHLTEYRAIVPGPAISPPPHPAKDYARYGRQGSRSAVIVEAAEAYLRNQKKRAQTSEIVSALSDARVTLPSGNVIGVVSSYLSTSPLFDHVKGEGYGLVEWRAGKSLGREDGTSTALDGEVSADTR